ncbi:MAG: sulfatase-like hydrolase/transferase [Elusimicrobia bacterium]|nr:sulfatase-like hydrolase/transferase [Elusimicrobiota bacterium]
MSFLLLAILHARATWTGLVYSGFSDWSGWAAGQMFFLGVLILLAVARRQWSWTARAMPWAAAALGLGLAAAGWGLRASGDTFRVFGTDAAQTPLRLLRSSLLAAADWSLLLDLILAAAAVALSLADLRRHYEPLARKRALAAAAAGAAMLFAGAWRAPRDTRLESPLLAILRSESESPPRLGPEREADLRSLRYGSLALTDELSRELAARRQSLVMRKYRPNIVLIILESVGSAQLRPLGRLDPRFTPALFDLSRHGVLFPSVYAPFPGTVRSHVSVMTGGGLITWGSEYKELSRRYLGPTLPGELKKRGYRAAFFSAARLDGENSDGFYAALPFDREFLPESLDVDEWKRLELNSWGIDERGAAKRALAWTRASPRPFLLVFNTVATHHPYAVPNGMAPYRRGGDAKSRYESALHFTDSVVGDLAKALGSDGRGNTLLIVLGDHGEAFGDLHPGNFKENIRSFVLLADLSKKLRPLTADYPAGNGQILPTVLEAVDGRAQAGSLFDARGRIQYFFKNTHPTQLGLRDGQWKFIGPMLDPAQAELYRLDRDPFEKDNLASTHPLMVRDYRRLASQWFIDTQNEFVSRLEGFQYEGGAALTAGELGTPGPKRLMFGWMGPDDKFVPSPSGKVPARAKIAAFTKDVPYPNGRLLRYCWRAPDGSRREFTLFHSGEWSDVYAFPQARFAMTPGRWSLRILDGSRALVGGELTVLP